jgi:hypothetical protein
MTLQSARQRSNFQMCEGQNAPRARRAPTSVVRKTKPRLTDFGAVQGFCKRFDRVRFSHTIFCSNYSNVLVSKAHLKDTLWHLKWLLIGTFGTVWRANA